ncbi:hypothetical protein OIU77_000290 [Salix suchowensis]|uniref:Uncharacterized protein n=1 Tax=Salix suchowensis TaxID=1278906 RepID=A0ABQ9B6A3_9ROSI|nr:hypothetical protein OIU77_000290 [Salix suchowensis]
MNLQRNTYIHKESSMSEADYHFRARSINIMTSS